MKHTTYYSASETSFNALNTSCSSTAEMKLFPSGSKLLNTRLATSLGVSGLTKRFSKENNTVKLSLNFL